MWFQALQFEVLVLTVRSEVLPGTNLVGAVRTVEGAGACIAGFLRFFVRDVFFFFF